MARAATGKKSGQSAQLAGGVALDLFSNQAGYLTKAKKIYLQQIEQTERTYLLAVGGTMLFLSTDALNSVHPTFYAFFWLVPAGLSIFTYRKVRSLHRSLADISDFEIEKVEPLMGDSFAGWEGYLRSHPRRLGGREGSHTTSLLKFFWLALAGLNLGFVAYQLFVGRCSGPARSGSQPRCSWPPLPYGDVMFIHRLLNATIG